MGKKIEVYVMNREVVTQTSFEGRPLAAGGTVHYCTIKELAKTRTGIMLSDEEDNVLNLARTFAKENEVDIRIIDVARFRGKIRAILKRVTTTPTVIVGDKRIVGASSKAELEVLLKRAL